MDARGTYIQKGFTLEGIKFSTFFSATSLLVKDATRHMRVHKRLYTNFHLQANKSKALAIRITVNANLFIKSISINFIRGIWKKKKTTITICVHRSLLQNNNLDPFQKTKSIGKNTLSLLLQYVWARLGLLNSIVSNKEIRCLRVSLE